MPWLLATLYDRFMQRTEAAVLGAWRAELLRDLSGDVLEIGAGTGANLVHYPPAVGRLVLMEPDRHMRRRLEARCRTLRRSNVEIVAGPLEDLLAAGASFDAVAASLVFCSVPDLPHTLRVTRDLLRPGGRLLFMEHVAAPPDTGTFTWQRRLEPLWRRVAGNCHLTRRTEEAIRDAGFQIERIERESLAQAPAIVRSSIRGIARKPLAEHHG